MLIETCEARRLLSVTVRNDTLRIYLDNTNNVVEFRELNRSTLRVTVDGTAYDFSYSSIQRADIQTYGGSDTIILGPRVKFPTFIDGGRGDDSITGGDGNDSILGGGGTDYIAGRGGNDTIIGGQQGDSMLGGDGDDLLVPLSDPSVDDIVSGGRGTDTVSYANETKRLTLLVGNSNPADNKTDIIQGDVEVLIGGTNSDFIKNESGRAMTLIGGAGNDTLIAGNSGDRLEAGAGTDVLVGGSGNDIFVLNGRDSLVDSLTGNGGSDVLVDPENEESFDVVNI
jgi:Ca2+-binding RTX toxin-like protein